MNVDKLTTNTFKDFIRALLCFAQSIVVDRPEAASIRYDTNSPVLRRDRPAAGRTPAFPAGGRNLQQGRAVIELPPENIRRWTIRRKAAVVNAVKSGQITRAEVCRRYQISEEEFLSWQRRYEAFGLPGLRMTRLQQYRRAAPGRGPVRCR